MTANVTILLIAIALSISPGSISQRHQRRTQFRSLIAQQKRPEVLVAMMRCTEDCGDGFGDGHYFHLLCDGPLFRVPCQYASAYPIT